MAFQVSAGLNVSEYDLTLGIPSVSTTEGAAVGHFRWGPVMQRVLVDSEDTLTRQFSTPNSNTYQDFFPAAQFLSYANKLYVVRVVSANTIGTGGNTVARNAITATANTKNTLIKNSEDYFDNYSSGISGVGVAVAKYPGELGNSLRIGICPTTNAFSSTLTGTLAFTNNSTTVTGTGSAFTTQVSVGDILLCGPDKLQIKVGAVTNTTSLTLQTKYVGNTVSGTTVSRRWEFYNYFDAAPGTSDYASRVGGSQDEMHIVVVDEDGKFTGIANNVLERFEKVSKAADAIGLDGAGKYYVNVLNNQSQYIWWTAHPSNITNAGRNAAGVSFQAGNQSAPTSTSFVYGRDGKKPSDGQYIAGWGLFVNPEQVDVSLLIGGEASQTTALYILNNVAENRKDCLAFISPSRASAVNNSNYVNKEADDIVTFRNNLPSTSYGTMDSGFKYVYDKYNDVYRYVACSGDTAGVTARTDFVRDPWYSPAGYDRGQIKNVIRLSFNPNKAARDYLYKNGVNPIVSFPGEGTVLFGDKTLLTKPSAFSRINVRRLFITLEKQISTAAKYLLFEFNDEFTRAQFRNMVEPLLRDVQGRRGIYDFKVVCDESNNTPDVIDRFEFRGDIFIKPAKAINFMQLNFVATRTGVDFTEIENAF